MCNELPALHDWKRDLETGYFSFKDNYEFDLDTHRAASCQSVNVFYAVSTYSRTSLINGCIVLLKRKVT